MKPIATFLWSTLLLSACWLGSVHNATAQLVPQGIQIRPNVQGVLRQRIGIPQQNQEVEPAEPIEGVSFAAKSGALESAQPVFDRILKLQTENGKLRAGLPNNYQEASQNLRQVAQGARLQFSGTSMGNDSYYLAMSSNEMSGSISSSGSTTVLQFAETEEDRRSLLVAQTESLLRIYLSDEAGYYLGLTIGPGSQVHAVECDGDFYHNKRFKNLPELQFSDNSYFNLRLKPVLQRFGMELPNGAYSPDAKTVLKACLTFPAGERERFFQTFGENLDSDEYQARQRAQGELTEQFDVWKNAILAISVDPAQPTEIRNQLLSILRNKDPNLFQVLNHSVLPDQLMEDLAFLIWALKDESESDDPNQEFSQKLRTRIAGMTGDPEDTPLETWVSSQFDRIEFEEFPNLQKLDHLPQLAGEEVTFQTSMDTLLPFEVVAGQLRLDRPKWKEPYGELTLAEHYQAVQESLREHHLPTSWLQPSVGSLDQDVYPCLLFQEMSIVVKTDPNNQNARQAQARAQQAAMMRSSMMRRRNRNQNLSYQKNSNGHFLEFQMGQNPIALETSPIAFTWTQIEGQEFLVSETPGESIRISFQSLVSGQKLLLLAKPDRFDFLSVDGTEICKIRCDNYAQFCQEYPEIAQLLATELKESVNLTLPIPNSASNLQDSVEANQSE